MRLVISLTTLTFEVSRKPCWMLPNPTEAAAPVVGLPEAGGAALHAAVEATRLLYLVERRAGLRRQCRRQADRCCEGENRGQSYAYHAVPP